MWPVYSQSIFMGGAWVSFLHVDVRGTRRWVVSSSVLKLLHVDVRGTRVVVRLSSNSLKLLSVLKLLGA